MSDHLDRAADDTQARAAVVIEQATPADVPGYRMRYAVDAARALAAAGLLASPEHDAAVAALPLPGDGCSCTPHEQSAGGVYTEYLLEYEPACPEHSEHLWDPTQGVWVLRSERDAAVAARAWDEGFTRGFYIGTSPLWVEEFDASALDVTNPYEREAGESDADA